MVSGEWGRTSTMYESCGTVQVEPYAASSARAINLTLALARQCKLCCRPSARKPTAICGCAEVWGFHPGRAAGTSTGHKFAVQLGQPAAPFMTGILKVL